MRNVGAQMAVVIVVLAAMPMMSADDKRGDAELSAIRRAKSVTAFQLNATLPQEPLERWFRSLAGEAAKITWESNDCGEQDGSGKQTQLPVCVDATIETANQRAIIVRILIGTMRKARRWKVEYTRPSFDGIYLPSKLDCSPQLIELPRLLSESASQFDHECSKR